jgi:hypothetical protein
MLTEEQIVSNWEKFIGILDVLGTTDKTSDNRWNKLYTFYDKHADRIAMMPASSKTSYHSSFPGGYIFHILKVLECAKDVYKSWKKNGATINFSEEELMFVCLFHDKGKEGDLDNNQEYYVENDSDWHVKRGEVYKTNPELSFMKVPDRSLFMLQKHCVEVSENEYLAIKLHDALYEDGNKSYLISYSPEYALRTNLPYILHQADLMAAKIESDLFKK